VLLLLLLPLSGGIPLMTLSHEQPALGDLPYSITNSAGVRKVSNAAAAAAFPTMWHFAADACVAA
jgi:hypothetical protein